MTTTGHFYANFTILYFIFIFYIFYLIFIFGIFYLRNDFFSFVLTWFYLFNYYIFQSLSSLLLLLFWIFVGFLLLFFSVCVCVFFVCWFVCFLFFFFSPLQYHFIFSLFYIGSNLHSILISTIASFNPISTRPLHHHSLTKLYPFSLQFILSLSGFSFSSILSVYPLLKLSLYL